MLPCFFSIFSLSLIAALLGSLNPLVQSMADASFCREPFFTSRFSNECFDRANAHCFFKYILG